VLSSKEWKNFKKIRNKTKKSDKYFLSTFAQQAKSGNITTALLFCLLDAVLKNCLRRV